MAPNKKVAEAKNTTSTMAISPEEFSYTRNLIIVGLAELQTAVNAVQTAIQDLSKGYIERTYDMVGEHSATDPQGTGRLFADRATTPAVEKGPENSKKRKRAPVDPNAPKRPVTAYFLYMKTHRPKIQEELGPGVSAKEVADEGTRRWNAKTKEEQHVWRLRYWINRAAYKVKLQAYKEGKEIPDISDAEAKKLFEEQSKSGQLLEDAGSDDEVAAVVDKQAAPESPEESSDSSDDDEPVKEPSPPKSNKRQKTSKAIKAKAPVPREPSSSPAPASPVKPVAKDKKAKAARKSITKETDPVPEPKETPATKKDKLSKKKRKSDVGEG